MLNKVVLIGRLTKDPEQRFTTNGICVTTFTLAVDRRFNNQQGEKQADFIPIVTWRSLAELCGKYLGKGRLVAVAGQIQTRSYDTPEGQRRYITEVVADEVQFLDKGNTNNTPYNNEFQRNEGTPAGFNTITEEDDDELPF